jgi:hypothetical protein
MSEVVTIVVSGASQEVEVVTTVINQQVSVYTGGVSEGGVINPISKLFYTATGSEGPGVTVPGIGSALWTQIIQGAIPLEEVQGIPQSLQYTISGDNVVFGNHPQAGENILFQWQ